MKVETFEPLLNQKFTITFDREHQYEFELIEVNRKPFIESLDIEPFVLYFRGESTLPIFRQGIYQVSHESIETVELFLIPRQPDEKGIYYEFIRN